MLICDACKRRVKITYHVVVDEQFKNYCWHCKEKQNREVIMIKYTRHHVVPKSRSTKAKRTVMLPEKFHDSWHGLFGNLKPHEAVRFLKEFSDLMYSQGRITNSQIQKLREKIKGGIL